MDFVSICRVLKAVDTKLESVPKPVVLICSEIHLFLYLLHLFHLHCQFITEGKRSDL